MYISLIGCGKISHRHVSAINDHPSLKLLSACDINSEMRKIFSEKYNVPVFSNIEEMVNAKLADIVVVLTSSGTHFKIYNQVKKYFDKIIIEKPLALKLEDARRIIEDEKSGKKIFIVKQNRFNKPVILCKELIDEGLLGDLFLGSIRVRWCRTQSYYDSSDWRGTWSRDGGVLSNQAIHHIDLLLYLMGKYKSVNAITKTFGSKIEVEDTAVAQVEFQNNSLGLIEATTATRPIDLEGSISLLGSKGSIDIGGFAVNLLRRLELNDERTKRYYSERINQFSENPKEIDSFAHKEFYKRVTNAIINDENDSAIIASSGIECLKLLHSIYVSAHEKRLVNASEEASYKPLGSY